MVVVVYGITSRVAKRAVQMARAQGLKLASAASLDHLAIPGKPHIRNWPSAMSSLRGGRDELGQMVHEVERAPPVAPKTELLSHAGGRSTNRK